MRQRQRNLGVDAQQVQFLLQVVVGEVAGQAVPGVVHQHVHRVRGVRQPRGHRGDALLGEQVGGQGLDGDRVARAEPAAVSAKRCPSRATSTRPCPRAANCWANSAPKPEVPPVISAV